MTAIPQLCVCCLALRCRVIPDDGEEQGPGSRPAGLLPTETYNPDSPWVAFTDPDSGRRYYADPDSGESAWDMPSEGVCRFDGEWFGGECDFDDY